MMRNPYIALITMYEHFIANLLWPFSRLQNDIQKQPSLSPLNAAQASGILS